MPDVRAIAETSAGTSGPANRAGGLTMLDVTALVTGAAVASVHFRDFEEDIAGLTLVGWTLLVPAFAWLALTAAGPFVFLVRRFSRRPEGYPGPYDWLWLGLRAAVGRRGPGPLGAGRPARRDRRRLFRFPVRRPGRGHDPRPDAALEVVPADRADRRSWRRAANPGGTGLVDGPDRPRRGGALAAPVRAGDGGRRNSSPGEPAMPDLDASSPAAAASESGSSSASSSATGWPGS